MKEQESIVPVIFVALIAAVVGLAVHFSTNEPKDDTAPFNNAGTTGRIIEPVDDLIRVSTPHHNQPVKSPLVIEGQARGLWFFEGDFPVKLLDGDGGLLVQSVAAASSEWMTTDFVSFRAEFKFTVADEQAGTVVLQRNNPSGLIENNQQLKIPVVLQPPEMMKIKVFFNNENYDPEFLGYKVFPSERLIPKTQAVARAALEELLKGPNEKEKAEGYFTSINQGVKIQKLSIKNGIAWVDFDRQIEFQLGGSARVGAIRAQITETLKQFPTVDNVIISVDGRIDDALQP